MVIGFKLPMMLVRLFTLVEVLDRTGFRAEMPEMIASPVAAFPRMLSRKAVSSPPEILNADIGRHVGNRVGRQSREWLDWLHY